MGDGIYLNNCHDGLHGPIDTWSWDWCDVFSWATWDPTKRHRWIDDVVVVVVFQMFIYFVLLWIERHGLRLVGLLSSFGTCWTNRPRTPCSHLEHYAEYDMYVYIYIHIFIFDKQIHLQREIHESHQSMIQCDIKSFLGCVCFSDCPDFLQDSDHTCNMISWS